MRRTIILLLVMSLSIPAHAGPGPGPGPHGHGGFDWFGLAFFGIITSLIFVAEQNRPQPAYQQGQPVYIERPDGTPTQPSGQANTWYYCSSSAMYYPYTMACPEGWQAIQAKPDMTR
jgi:hypothetical protein